MYWLYKLYFHYLIKHLFSVNFKLFSNVSLLIVYVEIYFDICYDVICDVIWISLECEKSLFYCDDVTIVWYLVDFIYICYLCVEWTFTSEIIGTSYHFNNKYIQLWGFILPHPLLWIGGWGSLIPRALSHH